jgi:hypothetical protein
MQSQIDNDVPKDARCIYISDRLDSLTESINEQYKQYTDLEGELVRLKSEIGALEPPIRASIERAVIPTYKIKERKERQLRFLVGLVLVLIILPSELSPNNLLYGYFGTIFYAEDVPRNAIFGTIFLAGVIVSVIMWLVATRWIVPHLKRTPWVVRLVGLAVAIDVLALVLVTVFLIDQSSIYDSFNSSPTNSIGIACIIATILLGALLAALWGLIRRLFRGLQFPSI